MVVKGERRYLCRECGASGETCEGCEEEDLKTKATRIMDFQGYHLHLCAKHYRHLETEGY